MTIKDITARRGTWKQIESLLAEYEAAQTEAMRATIAETWDSLRQRLQVVALQGTQDPESTPNKSGDGEPK